MVCAFLVVSVPCSADDSSPLTDDERTRWYELERVVGRLQTEEVPKIYYRLRDAADQLAMTTGYVEELRRSGLTKEPRIDQLLELADQLRTLAQRDLAGLETLPEISPRIRHSTHAYGSKVPDQARDHIDNLSRWAQGVRSLVASDRTDVALARTREFHTELSGAYGELASRLKSARKRFSRAVSISTADAHLSSIRKKFQYWQHLKGSTIKSAPRIDIDSLEKLVSEADLLVGELAQMFEECDQTTASSLDELSTVVEKREYLAGDRGPWILGRLRQIYRSLNEYEY